MVQVSMREMLEAGVHFGHQVRKWNPRVSFHTMVINGEKAIVGFQEEEIKEALGYA